MALTEGREALRFRPWSIKFILSLPADKPACPLCISVLCPLGASSRVRRRSHTRHGVRPQKCPEMPWWQAKHNLQHILPGPIVPMPRPQADRPPSSKEFACPLSTLRAA